MNTFKTTYNCKILNYNVALYALLLVLFTCFGATKLTAQDSSPQFVQGVDTLVVYKNIPLLASSDKYSIRVRSAATNNVWIDVFANYTYNRGFELTDTPRDDGSTLVTVIQGYQKHTNRWSHTFGNIEMNNGQAVEVEIAAKNGLKIGGQDFFKATVHPIQKASLATIVNGKVYFTITKPAQLVIDINGQMDDYNAAIDGGIGHPIHAISLFANPVIKKPVHTNPRVKLIPVGTTLSEINSIIPSDYDTMFFEPGIHDIGSGIKIHPGKSIYIPGDAILYGTLDNQNVPKGTFSQNGENITIYGYGTISGVKIPHYQYRNNYPGVIVSTDRVITIDNAINYRLSGISTVDNANHTTSIFARGPGSIKWWKTITWRTNGDGIGDYGDVEDCFIRTADDCSYVKGNRRRCTFWKDANAALFHMATIPENQVEPIIIEDCDFIYSRLRTAVAFNGGGFQQRGEGAAGQRFVNVIARNLRFHDKLINMGIFNLVSFEGSSAAPSQVGSSYAGILFQNISIAGMAPNNKQRILGCEAAPWYGGLIFDNLTIAGTLVTPENHLTYFNTNEFVKDIWFRMPNYYSFTKNVDATQGSFSIVSADKSRFAIRTSDNSYLQESTVVLTATAIPGYKFTSWSGDVISTTNPVSVSMNSNKNVTANFEFVGFKTLVATSSGNGTVIINPTGSNHTLNSTVTLTAKPSIGYKFDGWVGGVTSQNIVSTIVMDTDKTVTANFVKTNDFAINYGGDQHIATDGTVYAAGSTQGGSSFSTNTTISNTSDSILYQSEKFGATLSYAYPVDNGKYNVTLKFAELSSASSAIRRFNILLEGAELLNNFHLSAEAGGNFIAIDKTYQTTVADGNLTINLNRVSSSTNNAKINAIQITRIPEVTPIFDAPVSQYCYGETVSALPTTSNNGITGTWSPSLHNTATTIYTFTPTAGQYATTANVTIAIGGLTTWNGISWDNGIPNINTKAIISGNYAQPINLTACSLDITGTAIVTVPDGFNCTISGKVSVAPTASLTFENNANLIQIGNSQNQGNTTVNRSSAPIMRLDYSLWSSPVTNTSQFLTTFSPLTSTNRFYSYNATTNVYNTIVNPEATPFSLGIGYLIRVANTHPSTPTVWTGSHTGVPNNGTIALVVSTNTFNAIGNPYPSSISANTFIDTNSLTTALYFWRKTNNAAYTSYATYTKAGGVSNSGGLSSIVPNGLIQVGQGFIAKSTSSTLIFNNAMRIANNENQFLKTRAIDRHRIWLNLTKNTEPVNQMMLAYMSGATIGVDAAIDGKYFGDSPIALTSNINNEEYVIQGRPSFDPSDVVSLNFKTDVNGSYNIAIDHFEGVFETGQDVYLVDNKTGIETDLKATSYTFVATAGEDNTRFSLKYQKTLKVDAPVFNENSVRVYKNNDVLFINSEFISITNVKVYDLLGRIISEKKNINSTIAIIKDLKATGQVLIVKVTGEDKNVVIKKVLN